MSKKAKVRRFVYGQDKPDVSQARDSAYEWHGRQWSPLLYCYASLECKIANEDFRKAVLKEIGVAMRDVEANPALYAEEEPAKLRNLKRCVETANTNITGSLATIQRAERRRSKRNIGLIFKGWGTNRTLEGGRKMASDMNQVKIDGRLVEPPKVKQLDSGARVASIRLANNRYFKGRDDPEWKERNGYFDVQAWNALADAVAGMSKGQPVHIEGALGQDQWTDAEGKQHTRILIEASKVEVRELKREKAEARDQEAGVEL